MKNLLVVEDDALLRESLVEETRASTHGWRVQGAASLAEARALIHGDTVDAALIDLGLPDGNGIDLIHALKEKNRDCEILVITVFAERDRVLRSLEAGASGYLLKSELPRQSGRLIETIAAGGSPLSPSIARYLIEEMHGSTRRRTALRAESGLSEREHEILEFCARGLRYAEIARTLALSPHTINSHLKSIYRKLMVNSRGQAIFEARRRGLLDG
jgi:DNA-binding NarL/FixJ family response regulator